MANIRVTSHLRAGPPVGERRKLDLQATEQKDAAEGDLLHSTLLKAPNKWDG